MPIDAEKVKATLRTPTFETAIERVEARAVEILKAAGLPTDGTNPVEDTNSPEWYAADVIWRIGRVREQIKRVDDAGADELARLALSLGTAIWTATYKVGLEANTASGAKSRRGGETGRANQGLDPDDYQHYRTVWARYYDEGYSKGEADIRAAQECGVSKRTIWTARNK